MPNHKCHHCGDHGDTYRHVEHLGGVGDVVRWYCKDRRACWNRWSRQGGRAA